MRDEVGVSIGLFCVPNYSISLNGMARFSDRRPAFLPFPILWTAHSRTTVDRYTKFHWD
jgi:hypothetical protein